MFKCLSVLPFITSSLFALTTLDLSEPTTAGEIPVQGFFDSYSYREKSYEEFGGQPFDTISLDRFGTLYIFADDFMEEVMECEEHAFFIAHQSPEGETLTAKVCKSSWDSEIATPVEASFTYTPVVAEFANEVNSWQDTAPAVTFMPILKYSKGLGDPTGYENIALDYELFIEDVNGEWLKVRYSAEKGTSYSEYSQGNLQSDQLVTFQYATTEADRFPIYLGDTVTIGDSDTEITARIDAFDSETEKTLICVRGKSSGKEFPFIVTPGQNNIVLQGGDSWNVTSNRTDSTYDFEYVGAIDMVTDWMDSLFWNEDTHPFNGVEVSCNSGGGAVFVDSITRDSLWGSFYPSCPTTRASISTNGDEVVIGKDDSVTTTMSGSRATYQLTDLFVGENKQGGSVEFMQVRLWFDKPSAITAPKLTLSSVFKGTQNVQILSLNGRVLHEFGSDYSQITTRISSLNLSAGVYLVQTPEISQKISIE